MNRAAIIKACILKIIGFVLIFSTYLAIRHYFGFEVAVLFALAGIKLVSSDVREMLENKKQ